MVFHQLNKFSIDIFFSLIRLKKISDIVAHFVRIQLKFYHSKRETRLSCRKKSLNQQVHFVWRTNRVFNFAWNHSLLSPLEWGLLWGRENIFHVGTFWKAFNFELSIFLCWRLRWQIKMNWNWILYVGDCTEIMSPKS